jgi:hypothetical protein
MPAITPSEALAIVMCVRGSTRLGLSKNHRYQVFIRTNEANEIRLVFIEHPRNKRVRKGQVLHVPTVHKNRVDRGEEFNAHTGDPTVNARFVISRVSL